MIWSKRLLSVANLAWLSLIVGGCAAVGPNYVPPAPKVPASFVEVTSGSGFTTQKQYAVVWADGQRGIVLSESTRLGDAGPDEAKRVLHDVTAVRYPSDQP